MWRNLRRRGLRGRVKERFLDYLRSLAGYFAELAHPVGAKREQHVCHPGKVAQKRITVLLDKTAVAQKRLDARPFVLRGDLRAHLKSRRVTGWTAEGVLLKDSGSPQHNNAPRRASLPALGFLGSDTLGETGRPLALAELFEAMWPGDAQVDDFGKATVVAEEVLRPRSCDRPSRKRGLERGDSRPLIDGVNQVSGGRVGEGIGHLVEYVVGLDQVYDRGWFR